MSLKNAKRLLAGLSLAALIIAIISQNSAISTVLVLACIVASLAILYPNLAKLSNISEDNPKAKTLKGVTIFIAVYLGIIVLFATAAGKGVFDRFVSGMSEAKLITYSKLLMAAMLAVPMLFFGNVAPKIPFNRYTGLRLPWTVRDEDTIADESERFVQFLKFMYVLYELSVSDDVKVLASSSFSHTESNVESSRIQKVKQYVNDHYADPLKLNDIADLVGMSPVAFSRFFRQRTGRTLSDYIIDIRLGYAARMLVDSSKNISEICYECGFNNLSNFNRTFKAKRNYTPRDFRAMFKKNKVIV